MTSAADDEDARHFFQAYFRLLISNIVPSSPLRRLVILISLTEIWYRCFKPPVSIMSLSRMVVVDEDQGSSRTIGSTTLVAQ